MFKYIQVIKKNFLQLQPPTGIGLSQRTICTQKMDNSAYRNIITNKRCTTSHHTYLQPERDNRPERAISQHTTNSFPLWPVLLIKNTFFEHVITALEHDGAEKGCNTCYIYTGI